MRKYVRRKQTKNTVRREIFPCDLRTCLPKDKSSKYNNSLSQRFTNKINFKHSDTCSNSGFRQKFPGKNN